MQEDVFDPSIKQDISQRIANLDKQNAARFSSLTRQEFLEEVYRYLIFNKNQASVRDYKDLDAITNKKIAAVFGEDTTWKDKFGAHYYQPKEAITR